MRLKRVLGLSVACLLLSQFTSASASDRSAVLSIKVIDPSGSPVSSVKIRGIGLPGDVATDSDGRANISLEPGSYDILFSSPGFVTQSQHIDLNEPTSSTVTLGVASGSSPLVVENAVTHMQTSAADIATLVQPQITIRSAFAQTATPADASLKVILPGQHAQTLNAADLKGMPQKTVTFHNVHTKTDEVYSGVPLTDLLAKYGAPTGDKLRGKAISDYIVATGSDGYKAVLSLAETDPNFHPGEVIVADTMGGQPIGDKDGPFRLVVTEDKRPARCVHNLVSIELRAAD